VAEDNLILMVDKHSNQFAVDAKGKTTRFWISLTRVVMYPQSVFAYPVRNSAVLCSRILWGFG